MADTLFNLAQLASWDQARALVKELNARNIGLGVAPETDDPNTTGIFTMLWLSGPGNFPEPHYFDEKTGIHYYPLLLRFNNGAGGTNVGLVLDKFKRFPSSPSYVWDAITREINSMV